MNHLAACGVLAGFVGLLTACGGVSEARFTALEDQVKQMQSAVTATGEADPRLATLDEKISTTDESLRNLEKIVETLQNELADVTSKATAQGAADEDVWADVDAVLSMGPVGIEADGDTFKIDPQVLAREVRAVAITGKGPKLAANKKGGLSIRGFRPDSMFDKLGLKNGDVIVAVNDAQVSTTEELSAALRKKKDPTTVKLQRKGKDVTLTYKVTD